MLSILPSAPGGKLAYVMPSTVLPGAIRKFRGSPSYVSVTAVLPSALRNAAELVYEMVVALALVTRPNSTQTATTTDLIGRLRLSNGSANETHRKALKNGFVLKKDASQEAFCPASESRGDFLWTVFSRNAHTD